MVYPQPAVGGPLYSDDPLLQAPAVVRMDTESLMLQDLTYDGGVTGR